MHADGPIETMTRHLEELGIAYEVVEHDRALTAAAEARAAGQEPANAVKSVLLRDLDGYELVVLQASDRLDLHKVRDQLGESRSELRLATRGGDGRRFPAVRARRPAAARGDAAGTPRSSIDECWSMIGCSATRGTTRTPSSSTLARSSGPRTPSSRTFARTSRPSRWERPPAWRRRAAGEAVTRAVHLGRYLRHRVLCKGGDRQARVHTRVRGDRRAVADHQVLVAEDAVARVDNAVLGVGADHGAAQDVGCRRDVQARLGDPATGRRRRSAARTTPRPCRRRGGRSGWAAPDPARSAGAPRGRESLRFGTSRIAASVVCITSRITVRRDQPNGQSSRSDPQRVAEHRADPFERTRHPGPLSCHRA